MMGRLFTNCNLHEMLTLKIYITKSELLEDDEVLGLFEEISSHLFGNFNIGRDNPLLSPSNILLEDNGRLLRVDLKNGFGNPHYRAPEVLRGGEDSFRSFIYNLGAIFYFIATRQEPYGRYLEGAAEDAHLDRRLPEPNSLNKNLSPELGAMIRKMMSATPSLRHKSIAAFQMDIDNIRRGEWPINAPVSMAVHDEKPRQKLAPAMQIEARQTPRRKVAVSHAKISRARQKHRSALRRSGNGFVYMLLLASGIWAAWYFNVEEYIADMNFFKKLKSELEEESEGSRYDGERIDTEEELPATPSEDGARPLASSSAGSKLENKYVLQREEHLRQEPRGEPVRSSSGGQAKWRDPDFIAGARLYNRAIDRLDDYTRSVRSGYPNPRMLDGIEDILQQAVAYFKSCQSRAPANVPIKRYIDNCYKMIAKCRHSKLLDLSR